ncbi:hypothetical protein CC78DRAFT_543799 [Lojkania enalia]|uniref:Secreted protein n=1 Tax=Lojkania enalia TaxID=147567 RepID=A0A9P4KBJ5_9PLEO|nr:hypothetical protein CC78DRAFT_543799 [Didymosphaeria enalia]
MISSKTFVAIAIATFWNIASVQAAIRYPERANETRCDELLRPTWSDCDQLAANLPATLTAGPGFLEGAIIDQGNCRLRFVACDPEATASTSESSILKNLMNIVKGQCGAANVGGAHRSGRACVVVEHPSKSFSKRGISRIGANRRQSWNETKWSPSGVQKRQTSTTDVPVAPPNDKRNVTEESIAVVKRDGNTTHVPSVISRQENATNILPLLSKREENTTRIPSYFGKRNWNETTLR